MERSKLRSLRGLINISLLSLIFGAAIHILASLLGNYGAMALGAFGVLQYTAGPPPPWKIYAPPEKVSAVVQGFTRGAA